MKTFIFTVQHKITVKADSLEFAKELVSEEKPFLCRSGYSVSGGGYQMGGDTSYDVISCEEEAE